MVGRTGSAVAGFDGWFATDTARQLQWFELHPLHNGEHPGVGGALLAGAARPTAARWIAAAVGAPALQG